jgi:competence protein ComEC
VIGNRRAQNKVAGLVFPARRSFAARTLSAVAALQGARGMLFPWVPVCLALGIGGWFSLPWEPGLPHYALLSLAALAALGLRLWGHEALHPVSVALLCLCLGALAAAWRAHHVSTPSLGFRYFGPVEGRILSVDRSQADALRLTLDRVRLTDLSPGRTPERVRISLHGDQVLTPEPGQFVLLTANLSPPEGPVEPGGFDFQRMAYFDRLGAVGYTRAPAVLLAPPERGQLRINRLRAALKTGVESRIPGDAGAFVAAIVTGDRSGLSRPVMEDLRRSNLAHLLAISGLHMGLLTAFVFGVLRYGLALIPALALRVNGKKIAAVAALLVGAGYLMLSGGNVATERAFIMVAVMLVAVLFDRRALSIRSVAMAASLLLILQPETLLEPGFQMSFAATTALVAGFAALRGGLAPHRLPPLLRPVATLVVSSALAGFATAPVAAVHFNRIADYGLLANLLAVPVMGTLVMPFAVLAALLAPFGLEAPALWVMEQAVRWILFVAAAVGGMEGAVTGVPTPSAAVLPLMAMAGLWLVLTRGWLRLAAVLPLVASLVLWAGASRPVLLISADGGLLGLMGAEGRALSVAKGAGFSATSWLENDGDLASQAEAAARPGFSGDAMGIRFQIGAWRGVQLRGKKALAGLANACADADIVITNQATDQTAGGCVLLTPSELRKTGALAITPDGTALIVTPTRQAARLWHPKGGASAPWRLELAQ